MPLFNQSILSLVIWRMIATTVVFVLVMAMMIYVQIDRTLLLLKDRTLVEQAMSIASYLEIDNQGKVTIDLPEAEKSFFLSQGKMYQYVVKDKDKSVLFHSPVAFIDRFPAAWPEDETSFFEFTGPWGTVFHGITLIYEFNGAQYLVQAAQSEESLDAITDLLTTTFLRKISMVSIPFIALLIGVIYWSIHQSLKPLNDASRQAQAISFTSPNMRISVKKIPVEIRPLVDAFNEALERLQQGVDAQKEFTANAAHELQTPLAILHTQIDALDDTPTTRRLKKDVESMSRLMRQLLDMARLDSPSQLPMGTVDLGAIVRTVCQDYAPILVREKRELSLKSKSVTINGNEHAIYRALRNILDNAVAHTPARTAIEISMKGSSVIIRDHGTGIGLPARDKIFERFWRQDHSSNNGSGLGLSIVKRIMDLHGGTISVHNHKTGGAVFTLAFPAPDEDHAPRGA